MVVAIDFAPQASLQGDRGHGLDRGRARARGRAKPTITRFRRGRGRVRAAWFYGRFRMRPHRCSGSGVEPSRADRYVGDRAEQSQYAGSDRHAHTVTGIAIIQRSWRRNAPMVGVIRGGTGLRERT